MNIYIRRFESILDWANYSEQDLDTDASPNMRTSIQGLSSFKGVSNKQESYHLLKTGYPEGLHKMRSILESIHNTITIISPQYEFHNSEEGCAPDVQAYIEGRSDDMFFLSPVEKDAPPSFLKLQLDMTVNAHIQTNQMFWAGATIFAAIECLRAQGCAVSMMLTHTTQAQGTWQSQLIIPNNIDLDTLSFLLTHPSVLRVIIFSIMEHEPEEIRHSMNIYHGGGYGHAILQKSPACDVMLSIQRLAQFFYSSEPDQTANLEIAQRVLKTLIDTKLERIQ